MESAQLNNCGFVKNDADLLILAFDPSSIDLFLFFKRSIIKILTFY